MRESLLMWQSIRPLLCADARVLRLLDDRPCQGPRGYAPCCHDGLLTADDQNLTAMVDHVHRDMISVVHGGWIILQSTALHAPTAGTRCGLCVGNVLGPFTTCCYHLEASMHAMVVGSRRYAHFTATALARPLICTAADAASSVRATSAAPAACRRQDVHQRTLGGGLPTCRGWMGVIEFIVGCILVFSARQKTAASLATLRAPIRAVPRNAQSWDRLVLLIAGRCIPLLFA